jgi:hypothetical protein
MTEQAAIQQTLNRYSVAASRAEWEQVLATYLPDGVWEVPGLGVRFAGREAIHGGLLHFSGPMDYILQLNSPAVIQFEGDVARAHSVIRECGKFRGRDEALEVLGLYADRLVRTDEGWKFAERVFEIRGMHSFPLSPPSPT